MAPLPDPRVSFSNLAGPMDSGATLLACGTLTDHAEPMSAPSSGSSPITALTLLLCVIIASTCLLGVMSHVRMRQDRQQWEQNRHKRARVIR